MIMDTTMDEDEELLYHPTWLDNPRGFIDLRSKEAEDFNHLLTSFLSEQVVHWDCQEETGWTFEFKDLILSVSNSAMEPVQVLATTVRAGMFLDSVFSTLETFWALLMCPKTPYIHCQGSIRYSLCSQERPE
jgi:hypothetical protein